MAKRRSLMPREHGAYAQLAAPILAALLLRVPTVPAGLLTVAASCAFLANEPLLVVLGHRGKRLRESDGARAKRRLAVLGTLAIACGTVGLAQAGSATVQLAAIAMAPVAGLLVLAWRRGQHSLAGEVVAASALPGACAPIASASGVGMRTAVLLWLAWSLGYVASVLAVHRVIARNRRPASVVDVLLVVGLAGVIVAIAVVAPRMFVLAMPLVAISTLLVARPPGAKYLRAVGVALVVGSVASISVASAL
jgi:hypothetical protein